MGDNLDRTTEDVIQPLWWFGFEFGKTVGGGAILGAIIGQQGEALGSGIFGGFVIGMVVWFAGTRHVNNNYQQVVDGFEKDVKGRASDMLGLAGDVETYALRSRTGSAKMVAAARRYEITTLHVGESSVAIHDDAYLKMPLLDDHIGKGTTELYFDQITSVNYDEPYLEIKSADGELLQYKSTRKPNDAMYDIQDRIREFKSS